MLWVAHQAPMETMTHHLAPPCVQTNNIQTYRLRCASFVPTLAPVVLVLQFAKLVFLQQPILMLLSYAMPSVLPLISIATMEYVITLAQIQLTWIIPILTVKPVTLYVLLVRSAPPTVPPVLLLIFITLPASVNVQVDIMEATISA